MNPGAAKISTGRDCRKILWGRAFKTKKGVAVLNRNPFFYLVAGIGFEPMTFGL